MISGPLTGIRILELGSLLAGPFAGRLLADLGAEVIKIESPHRLDPMRHWGQGEFKGRSLWWPIQSRNKKCVTLDLSKERGQSLLLELAKTCDAIIENFRPGTLEKWNLSFEALSEANPRIILTRVSGYGQTGPYKDRAGYASVAEAMGGLRHVNGYPAQPPPRMGISLGDSLGSLFAVQGTLAAIYRRDALGGARGQVVDVSLLESCFALLESAVPEYDVLGQVREPAGRRLKGIAPSNLFRSKDLKWVVIAANQDTVFKRLCEAIEEPQLVEDERFSSHNSRAENQEEIEGIIESWVSKRSADDVLRILNEAGVACGSVYTIADIFADEHYQAREMLVEHHDAELGTLIGPGVVPKFGETPGQVRWSGPWEPGAHNEEVFCGVLGLTDTDLLHLKQKGVI